MYRKLSDLERELNRLLDLPTNYSNSNIVVNKTDESITASLPVYGVDESQIDITMKDNVLVVTENYQEGDLLERSGKYVSKIYLPKDADKDKIEAKLSKGVLTITVGIKENAKPTKIKIKMD